MKNKFYFLLFLGLLFSCSESTQNTNQPTIQALKDNEQWEAYTSSAVAATANISIVGIGDNQSVTLKMELPQDFVLQTDELTYVTYALGKGDVNQAIYAQQISGKDFTYITNKGIGDGQIVITNYDGVTISGTFRFNAYLTVKDPNLQNIVNFNKGVFYKIPITFN